MQTKSHVPVAAVLVLNTPDDGRLRPKHVEWLCRNKTCTVLHQVGVHLSYKKTNWAMCAQRNISGDFASFLSLQFQYVSANFLGSFIQNTDKWQYSGWSVFPPTFDTTLASNKFSAVPGRRRKLNNYASSVDISIHAFLTLSANWSSMFNSLLHPCLGAFSYLRECILKLCPSVCRRITSWERLNLSTWNLLLVPFQFCLKSVK